MASTSEGSNHVTKKARVAERTMLACTGCKQRKLKCDGQSPKCQNCVKTKRECLVEDPATGLHRPRDYLRTLEAKVAHLESLLQQQQQQTTSDPGTEIYPLFNDSVVLNPAFASLPETDLSLDQYETFRNDSIDDTSIDHLSSEVALLCLSAAGREPHYFGPSSAISFARIASQSMHLKDSAATLDHGTKQGPIETANTTHIQSNIRFPSKEVGETLSNAYFKHIHPQYPFLHEPTFRSWEQECFKANANNNIASASHVSRCLVFLVYAIGALARSQHQSEAAEEYFSQVLDHITPVLDMDGIESIQVILGCAVYSIRSPIGVSLWKVSGMAIRHCIELGYHRSAEKFRKNADTLAKEMSKRCFWVAYDIDRVVSNILGRPGAISDLSIDAELPLDIDDENITSTGLLRTPRMSPTEPPTTTTGAIHVIKLRKLWSRFSTHLYPTSMWMSDGCGIAHSHSVEELRKELEDWRASTPTQVDQLCQPNPLSVFTSSSWFTLAYNHSMLLLYRPYITNTGAIEGHTFTNPRTASIVQRAFEECYERSRNICVLYRKLYQNRSVQFTWGSLHILFLGGLTYLYCLWCCKSVRETARQADIVTTCMACSTVLTIIAERWNLASSYREIFEVLSQRTINMMCNDFDSSLLLPSFTAPGNDATNIDFMGTMPCDPSNVEDTVRPQDLIAGLDEVPMPEESEWLIEELIRSVQHPQPIQQFE